MRYLSTNKDGSIATWACVPQKIVQTADGAEVVIQGVRRKNKQCLLYGTFPNGAGFEIVVGDENFDVSDMPADHIAGYTIVFPTFEYLLAKQHPDTQANIASWRVMERGEIVEDRSFRDAWRDGGKGKGIKHDMPKVREIHLGRLRAQRAPLLDTLDREHNRATGQKKKAEADTIEGKRQKLRDVPVVAAPLLEAAQTVEEVKAITLESLTE